MDLYFMSPPSRGWALRGRANFRSREAPPVDAAAARREWLALARAIEARGGTVVALPPPSDELTGMPYAAECGHVVAAADGPPLFLLPRMAAPHRAAERDHWARLAARMGFRVLDAGRGVWEAQGDVAELDGVTLLFFGGRTDREGMDAVRHHFPGEVLPVEIREPAFHGNMAALPLPAADRLLVCADVILPRDLDRLAARFGEDRLLRVSEEEIRCYATNGLPIGNDVLAPGITPDRVRRLLTELGLRVVLLPMRELCEKAGGASRCLVSHARVPPAAIRIPDENRLDAVAEEID
ncbi:MAG: amidinotransferase [Polyangiaceae bacterium]|nr:amidinotransferase [Polyangiaceae bacterium]